VREVKRAGGLVIAESEATAKFGGMPASAQETGCVDHVLAPERMPALLQLRAHGGDVEAVPESEAVDAQPVEGVQQVLAILRTDWNLDFAQYKPSTVTRRIERRLALADVADIDEYAALVRESPEERSALYRDLLIGVTRFFRDADAFAALEREVIPELIRRVPQGEPIRVWVAGCATGEEAYSLAILFHEALDRSGRPLDIKIFATDVHRASLEQASLGVFADELLAEVSEARLRRYFVKQPDGYKVVSELRQMIVFAPHDVTHDSPFTRLDFVSCRNLLIYFLPSAQRKAISLFHFALKTGGCLFLGSSETPGELADEFDAVDDSYRIYRKRRDLRFAPELRPPLRREVPSTRRLPRAAASADRPELDAPIAVYDELLERYMPPSLLVNERRELVESFGDANRLLEVRRRRPTADAIEMLRTDAKLALAGALRRVQHDGQPVRLTDVALAGEAGPRRCDVTIERVAATAGERSLFLFSFHERDLPATDTACDARCHRRPAPDARADPVAGGRTRLQPREPARDDRRARDEQRGAPGDQRGARRLERGAPEHQRRAALGERGALHGQQRVPEEARRAQRREQRHDAPAGGHRSGDRLPRRGPAIRRITPRASDVFDAMPQDVGRRLASFRHRLEYPRLFEDLAECLATGQRVEREVRVEGGGCWFLRILPYCPGEQQIDGVVITLVDIGALAATRTALERMSAIVESSDDAIIGKTLEGKVETWNGGAERLYGWSAEEAIGREIDFVLPPERREEERGLLARVRNGEFVTHFETQRVHKDGHRVDVSVTLSPVRDADGEIVGVSAISRNVSAQRARGAAPARERAELSRPLPERARHVPRRRRAHGDRDRVQPDHAREAGLPAQRGGRARRHRSLRHRLARRGRGRARAARRARRGARRDPAGAAPRWIGARREPQRDRRAR
jgi:two-component system CheB/CheR fusion protein